MSDSVYRSRDDAAQQPPRRPDPPERAFNVNVTTIPTAAMIRAGAR